MTIKTKRAQQRAKTQAASEDEKVKAKAAAEEEAPPSSKDPESDPAPSSKGSEPSGKCAHCGMQNEEDAKFCDQCGKSMAAKPLEDEEEDDEDEDEEDAKASAAHPPPPERMQAPSKMSAEATLASILGASSESPLAIKTAAIKLRQVRDTAAGITGKTDAEEIVGGLLAVPPKLERGKRAADDLAKLRASQEQAERWDLAHRLNATKVVARDKIFADVIDAAGNRKLDAAGKPQMRIRTKYREMPIATLRGLVTDLEGDAPKPRRNPFEPDETTAREAAKTAAGMSLEQRVERAKKHPRVVAMFNRPGNQLSIDQLAKSFVNSNFDLEENAA